MKREIMSILACPVCKGGLELDVERRVGEDVVTGSLRCPKCGIDYPIVEGIPRLLPPERG